MHNLWFKEIFPEIFMQGKSNKSGMLKVLGHAKGSQHVSQGKFRNLRSTFGMIQDY